MFHMSPAGPLFAAAGRGNRDFGARRRRMRQRPFALLGRQRSIQRHDVLRLSSLMCAAKAFTDGRVVLHNRQERLAGGRLPPFTRRLVEHLRSYAFGKVRLVFTQRVDCGGPPGKVLAVVLLRKSIPAVVGTRCGQLFCRQFVGKYGEQLNFFDGPSGGTRCRFSDHFFASRGAFHHAAMLSSGDRTCNVPAMALVVCARVIHRSSSSAGSRVLRNDNIGARVHQGTKSIRVASGVRSAVVRRLRCCWRQRTATTTSISPKVGDSSNGHYYAAIYPRYLLFSVGGRRGGRCLGCTRGGSVLKAWGRATNMFFISKLLPQIARTHLLGIRSSRCRRTFVVHCSPYLLPQFWSNCCVRLPSRPPAANLVFVVHHSLEKSCPSKYLHSFDASLADMYKMFACIA